MRLEPGIAVAVAWAGSCSSGDLTTPAWEPSYAMALKKKQEKKITVVTFYQTGKP